MIFGTNGNTGLREVLAFDEQEQPGFPGHDFR